MNISHIQPQIIRNTSTQAFFAAACDFQEESFVDDAARHVSKLSDNILQALRDFHARSNKSGGLLIKGMSVGEVPTTPVTPTTPTSKDCTSELMLLTVAKSLGEPVGYEPELGGRLIQNIVPIKSTDDRQVSTSSKVPLMFHTEAAFHPHRPHYLLLLCLKGDPAAETTLSSIHEILPILNEDVVKVLFQPRFRTAVDESYLHGRKNELGELIPVLSGDRQNPTMVFDADLMVGEDPEAQSAIEALSRAVESCHTSVSLEKGDLLVVDNTIAVHGRSQFIPKFDGTDRWLQRAFVVDNLNDSARERDGRVITTSFCV